LKELAARGGVTARTIHFYIAQGLLPPAGQPGPGARYSEAHLARLILIRRLQREHLPLAEIRNRLKSLDDGAVLELASTVRAEPVVARTDPEAETAPASRHTSALDYIRGVLGQSPNRGEKGPARPASSAPPASPASPASPDSRFLLRSLDALRLEGSQARRAWAEPSAEQPTSRGTSGLQPGSEEARGAAPAIERSQWDRIILSPDIELHIRRPLTRDQNKRVERLVQTAREILTEGDV
jgi:DNA-binding transcriptional MerR regulator